MFYFITMVIEEELPFYRFSQIENLRNILKKTKKTIQDNPQDEGRRISEVVDETSFCKTYDQMLFRIVQFMKPKTIVEVGTSVGISTAYLATPNSKANVYSIGKSKGVATLEELNFRRMGIDNVKVLCEDDAAQTLDGLFCETNKIDLLYFGRSCSAEDIRSIVYEKRNLFSENAVVIVSDIHRNEKKEILWDELKEIPDFNVNLELFVYGILFCNENLQRESYNLFYLPPLFN